MAKKKTVRKKKVRKKTASGRSAAATRSANAAVSKTRDKATLAKIEQLGTSVAKAGLAQRDPSVEIPVRAVSNMRFNKKKRILEMGSNTQRRNLFNLGQAKKFMQMVLLARGCKDLVEAEKTLSLRGMYYMGLHTIPGTKEKTFDDQGDSDAILEDLEVSLDSLREELHVFAKKRGTMVGNITIVDNGDEIDCRRMGTGGYAIPSICEPSVIQFKKTDAKFVLHVEKDTVWSRFNEDRFWETHDCILTEGSGQPPRGVRRLLHRLNRELGLPIYCLLDCDPWGHYIYSVIKQGSINLAFESQRMAVPDARFVGIRAEDHERCDLGEEVKIALNDRDRTRAKQIMEYPWFKDKRPWQREIKRMLSQDFKMEVESLITKDISYVTETYVPERLAEGDFLD
ncbi:MAG: DNA topoisomerase IV subunit A [Phycisphaerales bacterium]|nr:DNA topoisomerase IV subunit A [Phycisphaerae bacterium]NNF45091.1 DNA topoisomerase IV subunit A [Phycisphaerales bacterium]NNM25133.1 DNA topoisomerase IV subunit A [Phycisphaerales bacterium]